MSGASFAKIFSYSLCTMQAKVCEDASNTNRFHGCLCILLKNTSTKCRDLKPQIFLCTQRGALFYPTVGPIIIRSRWGLSVGQQGPTVGTKNILFNATKHKLKPDLGSMSWFFRCLQKVGSPQSFSQTTGVTSYNCGVLRI